MTRDQRDPEALGRALAEAEQARDAALAEAAALRQHLADERREDQHRLRNMFSVIRTVARRTAHDAESAEEYCGILDGRLRSYLRVQADVWRDWHGGTDLGLLLAGELLTFDLREGDGVELDGPPVRLTSRAAGLVALAFHELASAAIVSDRLGTGAGLRVTWRQEDEGARALLIDWIEPVANRDSADEPPSSWAEWVQEAIAHQLAGTVRTTVAGGTRTTGIRLPGAVTCQSPATPELSRA